MMSSKWSNYVAALEYGQRRLSEDFPLSNRLIREIHGILLSRGRGSAKAPGEFRRSQNWIGGSRTEQRCLRAAATHRRAQTAWRRWNAFSTPTMTGCQC